MIIKTKKGEEILVDDDTKTELLSRSWHLVKKHSGYYARRTIYNKKRKSPEVSYLHREIMNAQKGEYVDHINGNTLDNRKCNLRICKNHQNLSNKIKLDKKNTTGYRGVYYLPNKKTKWQAQISFKGKKRTIGYFKTAEEAAKAFDKAAKETYGEFHGRLNFE